MCILNEARVITSIKEFSREGELIFEITFRGEEVPVFVDVKTLRIRFNTELGGQILFYREGIYATSWFHLRKFLDEQDITLPDEKIPCHNCRGDQCYILCDRDDEKPVAMENIGFALSA